MRQYKLVKEDHPSDLEKSINIFAKDGFKVIGFNSINHPGASSVWFMALMEKETISIKKPDPPPRVSVSEDK